MTMLSFLRRPLLPTPRLLLLLLLQHYYIQTGAVTAAIQSLDHLPYDSNGHLASHILAYSATRFCSSLIDQENSHLRDGIFGHAFVAIEGEEALHALFGHSGAPSKDSEQDCSAVCLEKGTPKALVSYMLPHRYWRNGTVVQEFSEEVDEVEVMQSQIRNMTLLDFLYSDGCGNVEYGMVNYHSEPVDVYWVNENTGEKIFNSNLGYGERQTNFMYTFIGHKFEVYDTKPNSEDSTTNELIYRFTVPSYGIVGIGNHHQPHMPKEHVAQEVQSTLISEWDRHLKVKRTFSPLGFDKGRLPNDLFASLSAYYYNNRYPPHVVLEEWGRHKGVFVNYWETDVNLIQIPWKLKKRWQRRLKDLVQAWAGVEVETTDMYGMREYTQGARLVTHVDREQTHAVSLIVNIAQENVTRPWTIEVNDHADRLHEVVMQPGDIVYYESAKALHGRNTPLQSGKYINLFTHYRPLHDPNWYLRENPEGTPEPLIDVGECHLVGALDQYSQGAVQCENDAIGPHLSPTMFKATNASDLFHWWSSVGPDEEKEIIGEKAGSHDSDEL